MNSIHNGQKIRILILYEILKSETDENHKLTTNALLERLKSKGLLCDRKTLYNDIEILNEYGFEVLTDKSKSNSYYVVSRDFQIPELRILIDAVQAAGFITPHKSEELVDKIATLGGKNRADLLKRTTTYNTIKHKNESIFYNVSAIDDGITLSKKITFQYFDYDDLGKRVYRYNGARYSVCPLSLMINDNFYYLLAYSDKDSEIRNYRVDRMDKVECVDESFDHDKLMGDFNPDSLRKSVFSMFSGHLEKVEIEFDGSILDVVKDKFGNIPIYVKGNDYKITEEIEISPTFFGWCTQFGDKLRILTEKVQREYLDYLDVILKNYESKR
ncbi:MAG: helix-turn-helix transcriptional regulator [Christensenellales bacterium]